MPVDVACVYSLFICSNGGTRYHTCEIEDSRCGGEVIRLVAPSGTIAQPAAERRLQLQRRDLWVGFVLWEAEARGGKGGFEMGAPTYHTRGARCRPRKAQRA